LQIDEPRGAGGARRLCCEAISAALEGSWFPNRLGPLTAWGQHGKALNLEAPRVRRRAQILAFSP